jgi:predicted peptidase
VLRLILFFLCCAVLAVAGLSCGPPADDPATRPSLTLAANGSGVEKTADDLFLVCESNGPAGKHRYSLFLPHNYDSKEKYPAIVFLHGVGEQGDDGIKCRTVGLGPAIVRRQSDFPFIAIFPHDGGDWTSGDAEKIMLDALADVKKHFSVDEDRVALTGLSTGGKGVWVLGARHPEIFSCLVPISAYKAEDEIPRLTRYPIWAFHNDHDGFVNPNETRDMISKLQAAGANPKVTMYPSGDHNSWDAAYNDGELFKWMQAQHRGQNNGK